MTDKTEKTEKKVKRRGWVKNAAIIFLAVMLVLTYFSDQIFARSLPEVAAQYTSSGTITAKIRGSGTVTANEDYEVSVNQTRTVESVAVRSGDIVEPGDVLFVLSDSDSTELTEAENTLRDLELNYQKSLITASSTDYARDDRDIRLARDDLAAAQAARDSSVVSDAQISSARAAVMSAQTTVTLRESELAAVEAEIAASGGTGSSELTELSRKIEDKKSEIKTAETSLADAKLQPGVAQETITELETSLAALNAELSRLQQDYNTLSSQTNISSTLQKKLQAAQNALATAQTTLSNAQTAFDTLESKRTGYDDAVARVKQCQIALEDLLFALAEKQRSNGQTAAAEALDLAAVREKITETEELVIELREDAVGSVLEAEVGGIVKSVSVTAGNTTQYGQPLAVIEVTDRGYMLSFSVSNEQAKRLKVGDTAEVTGYYMWGAEINGSLAAIKNDPESAGQNKLLEFTMTGDIEGGMNLTLAVGARSADYDVIVPNSAIRSDSNGDFVLIVESRNTALKTRYIATRIDVTVLASDDTNSAVAGSGFSSWGGDYVITNSSKPLEPGMQVRMADS